MKFEGTFQYMGNHELSVAVAPLGGLRFRSDLYNKDI
ncbi:hypothetical protein [Pseudomonas sp. FEN]|nr:hypothetical protein [Pseudomonas sp. FEN]